MFNEAYVVGDLPVHKHYLRIVCAEKFCILKESILIKSFLAGGAVEHILNNGVADRAMLSDGSEVFPSFHRGRVVRFFDKKHHCVCRSICSNNSYYFREGGVFSFFSGK